MEILRVQPEFEPVAWNRGKALCSITWAKPAKATCLLPRLQSFKWLYKPCNSRSCYKYLTYFLYLPCRLYENNQMINKYIQHRQLYIYKMFMIVHCIYVSKIFNNYILYFDMFLHYISACLLTVCYMYSNIQCIEQHYNSVKLQFFVPCL